MSSMVRRCGSQTVGKQTGVLAFDWRPILLLCSDLRCPPHPPVRHQRFSEGLVQSWAFVMVHLAALGPVTSSSGQGVRQGRAASHMDTERWRDDSAQEGLSIFAAVKQNQFRCLFREGQHQSELTGPVLKRLLLQGTLLCGCGGRDQVLLILLETSLTSSEDRKMPALWCDLLFC